MSQVEITERNTNQEWVVVKMCTDINDYELSVEKQKTDWECDQKQESWKWIISYHGSVVASGAVSSADEAMQKAHANVPISAKENSLLHYWEQNPFSIVY